MRDSLDLRSALVAAGAALLLLSLFLEWYDPGLEAWTVFEVVDVLLAGLAIAALVALAPGADHGLRRALPWLCLGAFVLVLVQVVDPPPAAAGADERGPGAWLALLATALMAAGALLAVARISLVVDVQARDRRRRAQAVDARERTEAPVGATPGGSREPVEDGGRLDRLFSQGDPAAEDRPPAARGGGAAGGGTGGGAVRHDPPPAPGDADRTQPMRPEADG